MTGQIKELRKMVEDADAKKIGTAPYHEIEITWLQTIGHLLLELVEDRRGV